MIRQRELLYTLVPDRGLHRAEIAYGIFRRQRRYRSIGDAGY